MALVPFPNKSAKAIAEADNDPDWDNEEEPGAGRMSFLEHLDELRRRIISSPSSSASSSRACSLCGSRTS
jgi:hypothetical protein